MNNKILIVGLPFFANKYQYLVESYDELGFQVKVLINSNDNVAPEFESVDYQLAGQSKILRMFRYLSCVSNYKPKYVDCYDYSILTLFYVLIAKLLNIKSRVWLIGGELTCDTTHVNEYSVIKSLFIRLKCSLTKLSLIFCDSILAKENHHIGEVKNINVKLLNYTHNLHNCVPVECEFRDRDISELSDFIYANAVIESRHVKSLIKSFSKLSADENYYSASIYGFNSISNEVYAARAAGYSKEALDLYDTFHLEGSVNVFGFVSDIKDVYRRFKFFILPADVILANYALLEAMAEGVVPIVFPGDGYDKIVTDGINGIVAFDFDLSLALKRALALSQDDYVSMSKAAHMKIKSEYSLSNWSSKLLNTF
jgi:glycosyltransferase involved in cell wall biosynthesis